MVDALIKRQAIRVWFAENQERIKLARKDDGLSHRYADDEALSALQKRVCASGLRTCRSSLCLLCIMTTPILQVTSLPALEASKKLTATVRSRINHTLLLSSCCVVCKKQGSCQSTVNVLLDDYAGNKHMLAFTRQHLACSCCRR